MELKGLIFLFSLCGGLLLAGFSLPRPGIKGRIRAGAAAMAQRRPKRKENAREYVARVNGKVRESLMVRSRREARQVYEQTGQQTRYRRTLRLALFTGGCGALLGLMLRNPLLAVVLAVGCYYLPLWQTQFSLYRYNRFLNEELETALSLITTSYTRSNDILGAVEENLPHLNEPVRSIFSAFRNNLKYVDANAPAQIERMKGALDNKLFLQWCDSLKLCQNDHTLRATLLPIVGKFSDQKAQQQENETKMMLPLRTTGMMMCVTLSIIPVLKLANDAWYTNLMTTFFGQTSLVATAVVVLTSINKAIRLSKPIEYDV